METNEFRRTIFIEIVVAVIVVIFIEPFLKFIWNAIVWISSIVYTGFIDQVYRNASYGDRNYVDVIIFGLLYQWV